MSAQHKGYLEELNELRGFLKWILNKKLLEELVELADMIDHSYVERYVDLTKQSEHGKNCGYAAKAKTLFLQTKEKPISDKLEYIYKTFIERK